MEKSFQNQVVLDCTSANSTISSLAQILSTTCSKLRNILLEVSLPPDSENPKDYVSKIVFATLPTPFFPVQSLWFHASRVEDPLAFSREGILTTSAMQPRLTEYLTMLSHGLKREGEYPNNCSVSAKASINDEGPFAFLIRSVAVHAPEPNHNYSDVPESVEDIAGSLLGANYNLLVDRYKKKTIPCIVTFRAAAEEYAVSHAIFFAYLLENGEDDLEAAKAAYTCFDGKGNHVLPEDIVSVDRLD